MILRWSAFHNVHNKRMVREKIRYVCEKYENVKKIFGFYIILLILCCNVN